MGELTPTIIHRREGKMMKKKGMEALSKAKDMADGATQSSVAAAARQLNEIRPILHDFGYKISEMKCKMGLSPAVTILVDKSEDADPNGLRSAADEAEISKGAKAALRAIALAAQYDKTFNENGINSTSVEVELGLSPSVSVGLEFIE